MHSMASHHASSRRTGESSNAPLHGSMPCPHLLSPIELPGGIVLPNRVLMRSMHTGLEDAGRHEG
jgi:hypothetical protein